MDKKVYEFIASQTGEKIVERKTCKCWEEFAITDKDMEFYNKVSPVFNGQKYQIPAPTLCPDCRQQRRLARRNERKLYKRKCDLTGKPIISIYSPDSPYKVYDQKERWSDKWSGEDYGRDFDFSRPFFKQFNELLLLVPQTALSNAYLTNENSDYINSSWPAKNCYLLFENWANEDSMYWYNIYFSKNSLDTNFVWSCENCYQCIDTYNWYNLFFAEKCNDCRDSFFIDTCQNCSNCFMCYDLNNKSYCIKNKQYTKEEYENILSSYTLSSYSWLKSLENEYIEFKKNKVNPYFTGNNNEWVYWNYINNSKNVVNWFDIIWFRDWKYLTQFTYSESCYDCHSRWSNDKNSIGASFCYESCAIWDGVKNLYFSYCCWWAISNLYYSYRCLWWSNLFGCIWLRNKQYCILNKQYTKEEYEELVPKIIEHMKSTWERWEFFPASISTFGYNETAANEYFPLEKDEALKQWFKRQDKEYPINVPEWTELVQAQDLTDDIHDVSDEILKKAVICEISGKPFRIIKPELEFYRKHNLPLPRKHPDVRHLERLSQRAPRKLYLKTCDNCGKQVVSVYPADSEFKVYCEGCYNKEIY